MNKNIAKRIEAATDNDWHALGGDNIWLPYAQMKTAMVPEIAARTEGCKIYLNDGRVLVDGVASWWTACHGYNHPHIVKAMQEQLTRMPHVMFGGMNHEPALRLAKRLATILPGDLNRVFFTDSGSVAVEVALKMAVQYWLNKGEEGRSKFVSFRHGYHGETAACMALSGPDPEVDEKVDLYLNMPYRRYLPKQFVANLPRDEKSVQAFDELLQRERANIAAVIFEPLVQGAGGMIFHDAATMKRISEICKKHNVLLIADEIFTGFGRTGSMFACEQAGVVPDIMCLGKALTGGAIGMAAVVARTHVFDAFWSDKTADCFMHGTTYMASPLACAAANASLDLFESEPRLEQVKKIESALREGLEPCRNLTSVTDVRVKGAIGVVQLEKIADLNAIRQQFVDRGVWIRSFGDFVYVAPAFTISEDELKTLVKAIFETLKNL